MALPSKLKYQIDLLANNKSAAALNKFKKDVGGVNNVVRSLGQTLAAAFSARELVEAANVMIGVKNRMDAFTSSAEETASAMSHMRRIALESRSDFDAVAMLFTRLSLATEHLGATQDDVANATQMVANTFIIAGSHAQEANNSARQLAQGLASGALRGDELRSVMENNTILTKMLADGLNMTVGELREFGHAGKLTAETVMPILIAGIGETNELIKGMPMTLGQAGVALRNNFQFMIGDIQESTKGFSSLANGINFAAQNLDAFFIPAMFAAIAAVKSLTIAIAANPLGALVIAFQAAVMAAYVFRNEIINAFRGAFQRSLPNIIDSFLIKFKEFQKIFSFKGKDEELDAEIAELGKKIEARTNKVFDEIKIPSIMDLLFPTEDEAKSSGKTGFGQLTALQKFLMDAEKGYKDFFTNIKTMQEEMQSVFQKSYDGLTNLTTDFLKNGKASFKDFATSIVNELMRIAIQKLIIDKMFQSFGGIFKPLQAAASPAIPSFNDGGFTGTGIRAGGLDGKGGYMAMVHPNETVIDHTKGQVMQSSPTVNFNISTVDAAGFDQLLASRKGMITSIINQAMNSRGKMGVV